MSNLVILEDGTICWDKYFEYLELNKGKFSEDLYSYASDFKRYSLSDRESLHDAWLEELLISELDIEGNRHLEAKSRYLSPYHDRKFIFLYKEVFGYDIRHSNNSMTGCGDVLTQEFFVNDVGLGHEINFSSGAKVNIICKEIEIEEISLN